MISQIKMNSSKSEETTIMLKNQISNPKLRQKNFSARDFDIKNKVFDKNDAKSFISEGFNKGIKTKSSQRPNTS